MAASPGGRRPKPGAISGAAATGSTPEPVSPNKTAGRPSDTGGPTNAITEQICKLIKEGNYFKTACEYVGVPERTAYEWLKRGQGRMRNREAYANYAHFAQSIEKANSHAEVTAVRRLQTFFNKDPKALQWFLERRFRDNWGKDQLASILSAMKGISDESIQSQLGNIIEGEGAEGPGEKTAAGTRKKAGGRSGAEGEDDLDTKPWTTNTGV